MGSDVIIFRWPDIDCHLRLFDAVEPLGIEDFSAQRAVEAFLGLTVRLRQRINFIDLCEAHRVLQNINKRRCDVS